MVLHLVDRSWAVARWGGRGQRGLEGAVGVKVKLRIEQDVAVLEPVGELDIQTTGKLREALRDCARDGHTDVVVDLGAVTFMDSSGLGVLVGGLKNARAHHGSLGLVRPSPSVLKILTITGLTKVFEVHDSLDALLASRSPEHAD